MPAPLRLAGSWGYAPLNDWARGPALDLAPFQALGYVPGSLADRTSPSMSPTMGDEANDDSVGCFTDDAIRDNDSP